MNRGQGKEVISFIINRVTDDPREISKITAERFGISRQAVNRYLNKLIQQGLLEATGKTRNKTYQLKPLAQESNTFPIIPDMEEDRVWRQQIKPLVSKLPENIVDICHYGFTEMFNNVLDHSRGSEVTVLFNLTAVFLEMSIIDDGVGIFNKIKDELGLEDHRHAILELAKGKLTTDPEHHTGEGIFFTTRMFDDFLMSSGKLFFQHTEPDGDWLVEAYGNEVEGTVVRMRISTRSDRTIKRIFDRYATPKDDYGFTKTHVPVRLLKHGEEKLVSRSQAKRLLARFDRFSEVFLDFKDVNTIGRSFADEIFRVFRKQNPQIKISYAHANSEIRKIIRKVMQEPQ
jgi:anti-sigma regulatory factor (Ser/Thr protein kinase)